MSRILVGRDTEGAVAEWGSTDWAWTVFYGAGWLFLILGVMNIGLLWIPFRFGVPEYEFASTGAMLDALPLPTMGLVFLLAGAGARGKAGAVRLVVTVSLLATVVVVGAVALYALTVPLAIKAVQPGLKLGIQKSIIKVAIQAIVYTIAYVGIARTGLRLLKRSKR